MTTTAERQMELTLPMVEDIEIAAARALGNLAREMGMSSEHIDEMMHAVIEACINAREHSGCADNRIYLRFVGTSQDDGSRIDVWVTDHGKGFDPEEARSRRAAPGTAHKRGRGLQLIESHMDEVEISTGRNGGTTIHMVKYEKKS
ncbi:MAG TPA: ATP-binding protein [Thermoanaerobaculia bacterium]|jgi:serine/threonine-protein kinase RsbW|nr:ATP-binding protein [Thermoanaerobaculia bacterium]